MTPQRPCAVPLAPAERKYADAEPAGVRNAYQIDRDRVLRCSAFRRLAGKTQVFTPHERDHDRTRMTHSLEVAQVARDVARALGLNADLAEAVALAHDLGHTPFGHVGEGVLDGRMAADGGFEHNRQSLRVVDYLEHPYPDFRGLNLTNACRECIARHETKYDTPVCDDFDKVGRAPLEGQIVDLADEIAYTAADLEDALYSDRLDESALAGLTLWNRSYARAQALWPTARPIHLRIQAVGGVLTLLCGDLLDETQRRIDEADPRSVDDVRTAAGKLAAFSDATRTDLDEMQRFLLERVYRSDAVRAREARAKRAMGELFDTLVAEPELLPERYRRRVDEQGLRRVVCDYVAGMTDRFCLAEHDRVCGG